MRQFFKFMFASMLGFFLSVVLLVFIIGAFTAALISSATSSQEAHTGPNSVLHIKFSDQLADRRSEDPFSNISLTDLKPNVQPGLSEMVDALKKAKEDPDINGIYLDVSGFSAGYASARELRDALLDFKHSGKFILAYGDNYSQGGYYLASSASKIWLHPEGFVELKGLESNTPFLKGLLAKLEIEPQVIRHGKYKSAVEPFILDKMSNESREQISAFVDRFWELFVEEISSSRKMSASQVNNIADSLLIRSSEDAMRYKVVDKVGYFDQFLAEMAEMNGTDKGQTPDFISLSKYVNVPESGEKKPFTRDRIAVIYAAGDIVPGEGSSDEIGGSSLAKLISDARKDDKIKAVVLRVNSPGGDALASDVVWREVSLCREKKPFVVSMGDVAASGGYYISCAADTIVAQPSTITGSIGVFGIMFNLQKMFSEKLGVTFDGYKTSPYADLGSMTRPLTEQEKQIIGQWVDEVYKTFTGKVASGRSMDIAQVDSLAQGRVWSGIDAKNAGLVDVLGGLSTAVDIAAKMAKLDNYRIKEMPELKDPFVKLLEDVSGEAEARWMHTMMGDHYETYKLVHKIKEYHGVQARSFYSLTLN